MTELQRLTLTSGTQATQAVERRYHRSPLVVIPAKAGIHFASVNNQWIPAFAGMT